MTYFGKVLRYEKRDAVKTNNVNFHIKTNHTTERFAEIAQERQIERYLAEVEQQAIINICPENQLKARLANTLEAKSSYELLSTIKDFKVVGNTMRIYLRSTVELNEHEKEVVLSQVRSIYSNSELDIESVEYVVENVRNFTNNHNNLQTKKAVDLPLLQQSAWGDVCRQLIKTYGIHIYNNWFSKLTPVIDEDARTVELKAPNLFVKQWVEANYCDVIQKEIENQGQEFKGIIRQFTTQGGMKKTTNNGGKNDYRYFKANIGEVIKEYDIFGQPKEILSLKKARFMAGNKKPVADYVFINKNQVTNPLFDMARQGLKNEISFEGKILEYEDLETYDGMNFLGKESRCKIGYVKNLTVCFKDTAA
jgi:hypothetical protein